VEFKHCSREANEAAHEIASFCYSCKSDRNWVSDPPSFILSKLLNDVIIV
jgi:hypothetical protein